MEGHAAWLLLGLPLAGNAFSVGLEVDGPDRGEDAAAAARPDELLVLLSRSWLAALCGLLWLHARSHGDELSKGIHSVGSFIVELVAVRSSRSIVPEVQQQLEWLRTRNARIAARIAVHLLPLVMVGCSLVYLLLGYRQSGSGCLAYTQLRLLVVMSIVYCFLSEVAQGRVTLRRLDQIYVVFLAGLLLFVVMTPGWQTVKSTEIVCHATRTIMIWLWLDSRKCAYYNTTLGIILYLRIPDNKVELVRIAAISGCGYFAAEYPGIDRQTLHFLQRGFKTLVEAVCDAHVHLGPDLRIKDVSSQLAHLLGCPALDGLKGASLVQFIAEKDREAFDKLVSSNLDPGDSHASCMRMDLVKHGGTTISAQLYHVVVYDMKSQPEHLIGIQQLDINPPENEPQQPPTGGGAPAGRTDEVHFGPGELCARSMSSMSSHSAESGSRSSVSGRTSHCGLDMVRFEEVTVTVDAATDDCTIHRVNLIPALANPTLVSWMRERDRATFQAALQAALNVMYATQHYDAIDLGPSRWRWPPWARNGHLVLEAQTTKLQMDVGGDGREDFVLDAVLRLSNISIEGGSRHRLGHRVPARHRAPSLASIGER